jgi:predicted CoA-substrate-specific enzyme activase
MIVAGIDVGSLTTKVVILKDDKILSTSILSTGEEGAVIAQKAMDEALKKASLSFDQLENTVATGYGKKSVTFTDNTKSEMFCHAKGAHWLFPFARKVIDIGAESSKVIRLNERGDVEDFTGNDKCAAGTGIFLDTMAKAMEVPIEEVGELSLKHEKKASISNMCAVFAESEVVSHVHRGTPRNDILAGILESIADRIFGMSNRMGTQDDVVMTGGVAKNIGMVRALEEKLGVKIWVPENPQIVGALGAALIARNFVTV